jgi:hypothetical protein
MMRIRVETWGFKYKQAVTKEFTNKSNRIVVDGG